ncbi:transposase [Brochothrix thermosphacta]
MCNDINNNKIKHIKRVSFGYKNFTNFRNRTLLCFNN